MFAKSRNISTLWMFAFAFAFASLRGLSYSEKPCIHMSQLRRMVARSRVSVSHLGGREFETASGLHPCFDTKLIRDYTP